MLKVHEVPEDSILAYGSLVVKTMCECPGGEAAEMGGGGNLDGSCCTTLDVLIWRPE